MEIINHHFKDKRVRQLSCSKNQVPILSFEAIIVHYTASSNAAAAAEYLAKPKKNVSAHMVIGRNGSLYQIVPFCFQAWHAGKSHYGDLINLNKFSIGIELDNAGKLTKEKDQYVSWFGKIYSPDEVYIHNPGSDETYWHKYTVEQLHALVEICKSLRDEYHIKTILGHSDITSRKIDPGPAFPMQEIRELVLKS